MQPEEAAYLDMMDIVTNNLSAMVKKFKTNGSVASKAKAHIRDDPAAKKALLDLRDHTMRLVEDLIPMSELPEWMQEYERLMEAFLSHLPGELKEAWPQMTETSPTHIPGNEPIHKGSPSLASLSTENERSKEIEERCEEALAGLHRLTMNNN